MGTKLPAAVPLLAAAALRRSEGLALLAIVAAFLATRLYRLSGLPMFFDEAVHLIWASRLWSTAHPLDSLSDGKLLQVFATSLSLRFGAEPLWAGRLTTVLVGAGGLWAAYRVGRHVGGAGVGLFSAGFYVVCPFALFYDRMNLADTYVSSFAALALLETLVLASHPRVSASLILALALAAATLAKVTGVIEFGVPPLASLLLARHDLRVRRLLAFATLVGGLVVVAPLARFFATTEQIAEKGVLTPSDWVTVVAGNVTLAADWLWIYWTPPLVALGALGAGLALLRRRAADQLLVCAALLPIAVFALLARHWFPRYVLPSTIPLLVLAGRGCSDAAAALTVRWPRLRRGAPALIAALAVVPAVAFDVRLLRDPARAPLPAIERFQYVEGWPSGYGWHEAYEFLRREKQRRGGGIAVLTEAHSPVLPAYFLGDAEVRVRGVDLDDPRARLLMRRWAAARPTYFVTSDPSPRLDRVPELRAEHAAAFSKPGGQVLLNLYRLTLPE